MGKSIGPFMTVAIRYVRWGCLILAVVKWGIWDSILRMDHALNVLQSLASSETNPSVFLRAQTWEGIHQQLNQIHTQCPEPAIRIELTQSGYEATVTCEPV